ncbi:MAG: hypothetical protein HKN19_05185 [Halioglobus sp.]|nr:hypothetical protein [Halioglobus sp.]
MMTTAISSSHNRPLAAKFLWVLLLALVVLSGLGPRQAAAALCTTTVTTEFTNLAGLGAAGFEGVPDTSFVACSTAASATANVGPFLPSDVFTVSVAAIDDDTFRVFGSATDGPDFEGSQTPEFWQFSALDIILSDISWVGGPGEITDVTYNPVGDFGINPLTMTPDSLSFRITPTVVGQCPAPGCTESFEIATIDVTAEHIDVPLSAPGQLSLIAVGLLGLILRRRKKASA